jgi:hypothetical protein
MKKKATSKKKTKSKEKTIYLVCPIHIDIGLLVSGQRGPISGLAGFATEREAMDHLQYETNGGTLFKVTSVKKYETDIVLREVE